MGNEQPRKVSRVTKPQIDIGCLKAKIHLELIRDRKNNEIIKGEKELVAKITAKSRNKTEELLIAERVVNGLKYAQACNLLMGYAATLRSQAHFIAENMLFPEKMEPWLPMIYSLIYAADRMGLSSLSDFKSLMRALNDPVALEKYVNPQIMNALTPSPTPEELNTYMLEFSQRNEIPLEEINMIGHRFTKEWNVPSEIPIPTPPPINPYDFFNPKGPGSGPGNYNPYQQMDPRQLFDSSNNPTNPSNGPNSGPGPNFYNPGDIKAKAPQQAPRSSINNINEIDYYPEVDANTPIFNKGTFIDPNFDQICQRLSKGL